MTAAIPPTASHTAASKIASATAPDTDATTSVVRGATVGSFTSVSLRPPIISFSLHRPSGMDAHLAHATHCEVSVLARAQAEVAALFADSRRADEQVRFD